MADHIPFVYNATDCSILRKFYSDSYAYRVPLQHIERVRSHLPDRPIRWIDASIDGLHRAIDEDNPYFEYIEQFNGYENIADPGFQGKPDKEIVGKFVMQVLDRCATFKPQWLSVPQLPATDDASRNKINRLLAQSTQRWKADRQFPGRLILPIILTHQNQTNKKAERTKRVSLAQRCYSLSQADGIWVVDCSLSDQVGAGPFEKIRFPALINFQQELLEVLPVESISVFGPHWGLNMILWARGLTRYSAIGLGNNYQYHLPGGVLMEGKKRIAIPPLRRWAVANQQLHQWIKRVLRRLHKEDELYQQLFELERKFSQYEMNPRPQVARFYKDWFDNLTSVSRPGRALALYQDLSSAFINGKNLPDLPRVEGTGRKPYKVAQQFMLNCL